jgi:hypothetical protein
MLRSEYLRTIGLTWRSVRREALLARPHGMRDNPIVEVNGRAAVFRFANDEAAFELLSNVQPAACLSIGRQENLIALADVERACEVRFEVNKTDAIAHVRCASIFDCGPGARGTLALTRLPSRRRTASLNPAAVTSPVRVPFPPLLPAPVKKPSPSSSTEKSAEVLLSMHRAVSHR